jgi:hypothetical protein
MEYFAVQSNGKHHSVRRHLLLSANLILMFILARPLFSSFDRAQAQVPSSSFVSRLGSNLMLNGAVFRAAGVNLSWLGLDENVNGIDYPTQFRVNDALDTAKEMGAAVIRSHTLGISFGCADGSGSKNVPNKTGKCMEPSLGVFNEAAFKVVDYAIFAAGQRGLKLIIPLVDEWQWYHGGRYTFTTWRGLADAEFWTNEQVIGDFKQWISKLLNRVNTYNGLAYKDDPTIMAWETGNELSAPVSWTQTIADYVKSIDGNHLVVDGHTGDFGNSLKIASVDIYVDHYYPIALKTLNDDAQTVQAAGKVYYVGEFGWNSADLAAFLAAIEKNGTALDTFWQIFPHSDTQGYVQHSDGYTMHYPGDNSSMRTAAQTLRTHAYNMRGLTVPAPVLYGKPVITGFKGGRLYWRGVAGGDNYTIQSAPASTGPWTTICDQCVADSYRPWTFPPITGTTYYRVAAHDLSGKIGDYSDPVANESVSTPTLATTATQ